MGRGEKVVPGVWRLRLPLPWPGVPHCNAWAIATDGGVLLVDTGMHEPDSWQHLELALRQCGLSADDVRLVVCTHAHTDHCGQAATVKARTGAEIWMHAARGHLVSQIEDPEAVLRHRVEVGRASGVPEKPLRRWEERRRAQRPGVALPLEVDRDLAEGDRVPSALGDWRVVETPGHAPSHVVLYQPEHRLLISGDHVLGRVSLYFDYGFRPDPVGDFLASLDRVDGVDARLSLSGHGRPFTDLRGHVDANRRHVLTRLEEVRGALAGGPLPAYDVARTVFGDAWSDDSANWLLTKTLCYLTHLERRGEVARQGEADGTERWAGR
jgi:glyoxylase-like metal-dependent hydrolase (beta-lactamase superfamily II)